MSNISCSICGTQFHSKASNAKYCSPECRDKATQESKKKWAEEHREYDRDRMREYRAAKSGEKAAQRKKFKNNMLQQQADEIEQSTGGKFAD